MTDVAAVINAADMDFAALNRAVRACGKKEVVINNCLGHRYVASAESEKKIIVNGVPGNALGAYLEGGVVEVYGNAQEAVGDTMNSGEIIVHGSCGDGAGYAMRGGRIMVRDSIGYRAGIHMKAYKENSPVIIAGGSAGSFLGEYQAGGTIIILGLDRTDGKPPVHYYCATGMYGGRIFLRSRTMLKVLPQEVNAAWATDEDLADVRRHVKDFCKAFSVSYDEVMSEKFILLTPTGINPYKNLYVNN